jgi:hypothetical protein
MADPVRCDKLQLTRDSSSLNRRLFKLQKRRGMNDVGLPNTPPSTTGELGAPRSKLCRQLEELVRILMRRELELMQTHEAHEFAALVRKTAEELSAGAATWARLSDSIRDNWHM